MAVTISTITQLIAACPAPVSTAEGVTSAITWLNTARVFADHSAIEDVPNKTDIAVRAQSYADNIKVGSTDYTTINNDLMHIELMYGAVQAVIGG